MDQKTIGFLGGVLIFLVIATAVVAFLKKQRHYGVDPAILETFRSRLRAWWLLFGSLVAAFWIGHIATIALFIVFSFWAFQEYITLTPTRAADNPTLFWVFLGIPFQFILVGIDPEWFRSVFGLDSYLIYSIFIPAYGFLIVPALIALSGDSKRFLERIAKIQVGLLICVYSFSFAPALLTLEMPISQGATASAREAGHGIPVGSIEENVLNELQIETMLQPDGTEERLQTPRPSLKHVNLLTLFYFLLIVQISDISQYLWSYIRMRHVIAPSINGSRTWEGLIGGTATTTLIGIALWKFTPLLWWEAGIACCLASLMGFAGSITMSAIKRDRGVEDYGSLIEGHSGVLDRIDSLCFAAPIFYHCVWIFTHLV